MKSRRRKTVLTLVAFLCVVILAIPVLKYGYRSYLRAAYPLKYTEEVSACAAEFEIPESLIYAVIYTESRFNAQAVSPAGAKGLMQLTDSTFQWILSKLGESDGDIFDPPTNIRCGTKTLAVLHSEFDDLKTILAAYNAGSGNVTKWLQNREYSHDGVTLHTIPFAETREYVVRVLNAQKQYQTLYEKV